MPSLALKILVGPETFKGIGKFIGRNGHPQPRMEDPFFKVGEDHGRAVLGNSDLVGLLEVLDVGVTEHQNATRHYRHDEDGDEDLCEGEASQFSKKRNVSHCHALFPF